MDKQLHIKGTLLKALPAGVERVDGSEWGIASLERKDMVKDVVRVAGIRTGEFHNPPHTHLKILPQHLKVLPSGEPAVIGRVEEFKDADVDGQPAKLFRFTWAKDGKGNVTEFASKYKDLYDGGYLDSFSIGFQPQDGARNKDGGYDITQSELFEISVVSIPCNPGATRLVKDLLGDAAPDTIAVVDAINEQFKGLQAQLTQTLVEQLKEFGKRLDTIEASLVDEPDADPEQAADPEPETKQADLSRIAEALKALQSISL